MGYDAFISYRRESGFLMAQVIRDRLEEKGLHCFLDLEELRSGQFDEKILLAIQEAHTFILILPKNALTQCSNEDDWVRKEILEAVRWHKVIIPVMFDGFKWPQKWNENIPDEIKNLERINGVSGSQEYLPAMIEKIISYMPQKEVNTKLKSKISEKQSTSDTVGFFSEMIQRFGDKAVVAGEGMPSIQVPPGKLAGGYGMCRGCGKVFGQTTNYCPECGTKVVIPPGKPAGGYGMCRGCGKVFSQTTNYCPRCGTKVVIERSVVTLDKVQFSALAPKTFVKGDYSVIEIFMYEKAFRNVVQEAIANADDPVKETKSGILTAESDAKITVTIFSPDFAIEDNIESQTWQGDYLSFRFAVEVPEQYKKRQILFVASVYFNDIIATRLKFVAKCKTLTEQKIEVTREDILSEFVSYASQDRKRVAMIIQGMKKARPDMDIFFDVDSLRSGDDWEKALWREIDKRDVLFLCWSKYARDSKWVDAEWRYAFKHKGADSIEPVPIDPPSSCPPPDELKRKHFNDKLLYIINSNPSVEVMN